MNEPEANANMENKCPQCGAPLPSGVLAGLCPACLFKQGAAADTAAAPEPAAFQPPSVEEIAKLFPQLEIIGFLGKGGMGAVYKARQPALDRIVALKIIPQQAAAGPGFIERFNREARALAKLNHPNIINVFEFGQANGLPYFIMEYVDGLNLRQLEQAGKLSAREALQIVPQICEALQFAHDEGIVHRDIKPENILLDKKGRVKIADFGIAKILSGAPNTAITETGGAIGTPHYMAPEQMEKPTTVDHRADIFSLGVVFYEMLTGELPLGKFGPPSSRKVEVDVRLDDVVLRALEKDPELRYQQASQVKTAVNTIAGSAAPPPASDAKVIASQILAQDYNLDIGNCLRRGWKLLCANFWPFVGITALMFALMGFASSIGGETVRHGPAGGSSFEVGSAIAILVWGPLAGGMYLYLLKKIRGETATIETVFSGFSSRFLQLFLGGFVSHLLIWLGFMCFILPGIFLFVAWTFTMPIIADKQIDFWSAMELSRKVITKHWFKFLGFTLVSLLLMMAGFVALLIGVLITAPWVVAAHVYAYEDIIGSAKQAAAPPIMGPSGTAVLPRTLPPSSSGWNLATKIGVGFVALVVGLFLLFATVFLIVRINHRPGVYYPPAQEAANFTPINQFVPPAAPYPVVAPTPLEAPQVQPVAQAVFGPVREFDLHAGTNEFLDLTGQQLRTNSTDMGNVLMGNWLRNSGAALWYPGTNLGYPNETIIFFDGVFSSPPTNGSMDLNAWETATPEQIRATLGSREPPPSARVINSLSGDKSGTYFFKTREGAEGILQIVAFANDPSVAKIRYKLVQQTDGLPPAVPLKASVGVQNKPKTTQPAKSPPLDDDAWNDRLAAANFMTDFTAKDRALGALAIDAAKAGKAEVARKALQKMTDFTAKDDASIEVVGELSKLGFTKQALGIAQAMTDFTKRDRALAELAHQ
jgi:predicted Ser/Thr protein kinase